MLGSRFGKDPLLCTKQVQADTPAPDGRDDVIACAREISFLTPGREEVTPADLRKMADNYAPDPTGQVLRNALRQAADEIKRLTNLNELQAKTFELVRKEYFEQRDRYRAALEDIVELSDDELSAKWAREALGKSGEGEK